MEPLEGLVTLGTHLGMCWSNRALGAAPGRLVAASVVCVARKGLGVLSKARCMLWWNRETKEERFYLIKTSEVWGQKSCQYLYLASSVKGSLGRSIGSIWAEEPALCRQKQQERMQEAFACYLGWEQQEEEGDGADSLFPEVLLRKSSLPHCERLHETRIRVQECCLWFRHACNARPSAHTRCQQTWLKVTAPKP